MSLRYVDLEEALRASRALDAPIACPIVLSSSSGLGCVPPEPGQTWQEGNAECHAAIGRALDALRAALARGDLAGARVAHVAFARALGGHADAEEATAFKRLAEVGAVPEALARALEDHRTFRRALVLIAALLDAGRTVQASFAVKVIGDRLTQHDELERDVLYPVLDRMSAPVAPRGLHGMAAIGEEPRTAQIQGIARPVSGPAPNPETFKRVRISDGKRGTDETLAVMSDLAVEASQDPYFVAFARGVVRECGSRDHACEAEAILRWVKENVRYRSDALYMEYVSSPGWIAFVDGQEDCDGMATLIAAMALAVGLRAKFRAVALNRANPTEFTHVFPMIEVPGRGWLAADAVPPRAVLGWEPPREMWVMPANDLLVSG